MTTDTIRHLGAEFHHAADGVGEALQRLERARADRLAFLRRCSKDSTARLAALKEEVRTLPEQIAKWDAEAARLESQTAEDLLRQALQTGRQEQPKPEPFRAGLPLRADAGTWQIARPVENCGHVAADGTCGHPNAQTPECHDGVVCPVKAGKPTLLDLTKLPPGTVCEAMGEILTYLGRRIKPGEVFRIVEPDDGMGDKHPTNIEIEFAGFSVPALVPARVVKEGGEQ